MSRFIILGIKLIPGALLIYQALRCFFVQRSERVRKAFLLVSCSLLSGMIIQIADWTNILWTLSIFFGSSACGVPGKPLKENNGWPDVCQHCAGL